MLAMGSVFEDVPLPRTPEARPLPAAKEDVELAVTLGSAQSRRESLDHQEHVTEDEGLANNARSDTALPVKNEAVDAYRRGVLCG